jgi:DNA-binding CsgD family transcriptional regulator
MRESRHRRRRQKLWVNASLLTLRGRECGRSGGRSGARQRWECCRQRVHGLPTQLGDKSMSSHLTKRAGASPSQSVPSMPSEGAPNVTLADTFVVLCDWHGRVVWKSVTGGRLNVGDDLWKNATSKSKKTLRSAVANVASLRENCAIEVENDAGEHFRLSMWPLIDPEIAVCVLGLRIPQEISLLTQRERACLRCLSQGTPTRDIARELGIGLTTVHTHMRRSREKLGLGSVEALIAFAARYFFVAKPAAVVETTSRKRSG